MTVPSPGRIVHYVSYGTPVRGDGTQAIEAAEKVAAGLDGPLTARVFSHATFNPDGGPDGDRETCAVYLIGDSVGLVPLRDAVVANLAASDLDLPEQHEPFTPHVTGGYGLAASDLTFTGEIVFDRLRVALANDAHDIPLVAAGPPKEEPMPATTMAATAPAVTEAEPIVGEPNASGEAPVRFPVLVLESVETSDGRWLEAGSLSARGFPLSLLATAESAHGTNDPAAAVIVGRLTAAKRVPGPEVTSQRTGEPFPEGTFVWVAEGMIDTTAEVPVGNTSKNAYDLVRTGQLRGVSVDLAGMDFTMVDETTFDEANPRRQLIVHAAEIAAATLCPIPAFSDAYVELGGGEAAMAPVAAEDLPAGLLASAVPAWRSAEVGDVNAFAADEGMPVRIPADSVEQLAQVIDTGEERDATDLATAIVEHIAQNWAATAPVTEDELPATEDAKMAAQPADDPAPAEAAPDADLEAEGDPAEPQPCIYDDKPAVMSLLYQDGKQFVSVCADDEQRARDELEKAGETVGDVVPIGGGGEPAPEADAVVASAAGLPSIEWFRDPGLSELTPLTVSEDGRVWGHLASWSQDHVGLPGQRIRPPRSAADYSYFHTGGLSVDNAGQRVEISVGRLTMDTNHAGTNLGHQATVSHYDHSGTVIAQVCCGEDSEGIWFAGALMPGVDEITVRRFRACGLSGDWRRIGSGLELVAALSVPTAGFPVPRARVAAGQPQALVAAGAVHPAAGAVVLDYDTLADAIASRLDSRREAGELSASHAALVAELDDTSAVVAALLSEVDDSPLRMAELFADLDDEAFDISRMPPQLKKEWLAGKVAARIGWGSPGDFDRCVLQAKAHDIPAHERDGLCSNLHREALGGKAPGKH